jgi:hypothetical protein
MDPRWSAKVDAGLDVLPDGYRELLSSARRVFEGDERVRGMWLHGAIARGALDASGDIDIDIAVRDEDFDAFTSAWREWLAEITPTVSAIPLPGLAGSFYALTPTCERVDVISERVSAVPSSALTRRLVVFDRDDLSSRVPDSFDPPPDAGLMRYYIEETLRQAANFLTVIVREDWLLGVVAVEQVRQYLYLLLSESNKPQPPTGPKQWSVKLSAGHRAMLEALPVPQPERQSILDAREAAMTLFLTEGRRVAEQTGVAWPDELADAVLGYLDRSGFGIPAHRT